MQCENCHESLVGKQIYCANCGQKNIENLSLKYLLNDFFENYIYFDSKLAKTIKSLLFKPGFLSQEFIQGRRVNYVKPVRLYITFSVLFFFSLAIGSYLQNEQSFTNDESQFEGSFSFNGKEVSLSMEKYQSLKQTNEFENYLRDSLDITSSFGSYMVEKMIIAQNNGESFKETLLNQLSIFLILFIPFISLFYKWSFIKNKFNYINHVVFNIHFNTFIVVILSINKIILLIFDNNNNENSILLPALVVVTTIYILIYLFKAIKRFYERKWWIVLYKILILLVSYTASASLFLLLLMFASLGLTK